MKALFILGIVLLVLVLLSFVRLGAQVEYAASGVTVRVKTGPFLLTVFPRRGNGTKAGSARKKRKKNGAAAKEPAPKGGSVALVKKFLPLIAEAAGRMKRKIRIDVLRLDLTVAAADPAAAVVLVDCVIGYGSHEDPAQDLSEAIRSAKALAAQEGRYLAVVASVCGTEADPQSLSGSRMKLANAGAIVLPSNAQATRFTQRILAHL